PPKMSSSPGIPVEARPAPAAARPDPVARPDEVADEVNIHRFPKSQPRSQTRRRLAPVDLAGGITHGIRQRTGTVAPPNVQQEREFPPAQTRALPSVI